MPLVAGSIAFVGYNADGNDNLAFVALEVIAVGEIIYFEDNEWNGSGWNDTNEGAFSWTATSSVAAGTIVLIDNIGSGTITASTGTAIDASVLLPSRGTNRGIGAGDEVIYAYQGSAASPTFIAAIASGGFNATNGLLANTGLAVGQNALDLSSLDDDADIAAFNGLRNTQANFAAYLPIINNPANWIAQDGAGNQNIDQVPPDVPFSTLAFSTGYLPPELAITPLAASQNEGNLGTTAFLFKIERSGDTSAASSATWTVSGTGSDPATADDFDAGSFPSGTVSFAAGETSQTITVNVVGDTTLEQDEGFTITLSAPSGAIIDPAASSATSLILNDDLIQEKIGGATSATNSEIPAYDPASKRLYVVAGSVVDIYTISETGALTAVGKLNPGIVPASGTAAPNSVAIKNGIVAVAYEVKDVASGTHQPGRVGFYQASSGAFLASVDVGYLPDMLTFTADGLKVLVANEAEPNEDYSVDPEGSVSIIDLSNGVANVTVQQVGFSAYNSQEIALKSQSVRIFGRLKDGSSSTVAQDLEPEYIAVSPDGLSAAIPLQENNAVAILDLATATIKSIKPLGYKNHSLAGQGLDASDRDVNGTSAGGGKINIANWPVFGMFQPDGIASFTAGGTAYYITANEGDSRVRPTSNGPFGNEGSLFNEESRVAALSLDPGVFPNASSIKNNANLGRLTVTNKLGDTDGDGDFDALYAFGGRSFSIWDSSFNLVFDSGDQLEQITAKLNPIGFNSEGQLNIGFDTRSDNKGPEPEGIAVATLDGRTYAFIGLERVGDVVVYDITNPASPEFKQYVNIDEDVALEGLIVVSAADSPTGSALLIGANEVSKTVSVFMLFEQLPPPPSLSIHAAAPSLAEGNIGSTSFAFSIKRSGDLTGISSVAWSVEGSGATPAHAADFALSQWPTGTAVFASGIDAITIHVPVTGDGILEVDEDFRVVLSAPEGALIADGLSAATSTILNDDLASQTYAFTASSSIVYEGSPLNIGVATTNVSAGTRLYWQASGTTITDSDFTSGGLTGDVVIGSDGRASFTRTVAADPLVDSDEVMELKFYSDASRSQQVGTTLSITIKEPSVGVITDGNDIITGTAAGEMITGIPTGTTLRGRGSRDDLTGAGGDDIFALGDQAGVYYDDGLSANRGTLDMAIIKDFTAGDRIQLWGDASKYSLVSALFSGVRGVRIDLNPVAPGALGEAIGFVQAATTTSLNLSNSSQFLYLI